MSYQPKTGEICHCKRGAQRNNCPECEGTGMQINFKAIRARAMPTVTDKLFFVHTDKRRVEFDSQSLAVAFARSCKPPFECILDHNIDRDIDLMWSD